MSGAADLLRSTRIMTLATVNPDGSPHAVPVWFCWDGRRLYFATGTSTVNHRNLRRDPRVACAIEWGGQAGSSHAVVIEGRATPLVPPDGSVRQLFQEKYGWDVAEEGVVAYAVEVTKLRSW